MKIIPQSATLLWITPNALQEIEAAGRTAYKSEAAITDTSALDFIKKILNCGHDSVLEHASASIRIICDRGVSHEIVRHRLFSFTQESTRYCNYSKDKFDNEITVIEPPGLTKLGQATWAVAMKDCELAYLALLESGASPQIARSVLPNSLKTEIVVTGNFREWRHFLALRTSSKAHPQMREVAFCVKRILEAEAPAIFANENNN